MTNPTDSAFPYQFEDAVGVTSSDQGLTKREYFAAMALQGILASTHWQFDDETNISIHMAPPPKALAALAAECADSLLWALNAK